MRFGILNHSAAGTGNPWGFLGIGGSIGQFVCLFVYSEAGSKIEAVLSEKVFLTWNFPTSSNKS